MNIMSENNVYEARRNNIQIVKHDSPLISNLFHEVFTNYGIIAGGAATSLLATHLGEEYRLRDVDIFLLHHPFLCREDQIRNIKDALSVNFNEVLQSKTGLVTYFDPKPDTEETYGFSHTVELIITEYATLADMFDSFDCDISRVAYQFSALVYAEAAEHNLKNTCVTINSPIKYPYNTMLRLLNFNRLKFDVVSSVKELLQQVASGKVPLNLLEGYDALDK